MATRTSLHEGEGVDMPIYARIPEAAKKQMDKEACPGPEQGLSR